MNKQLKKAFIIVLIVVMIIFLPFMIISFSAKPSMGRLKYLIKNGRAVTGKVIRVCEEDNVPRQSSGWYDTYFYLYYEFKENEIVWETGDVWTVREDKTEEIEERRYWCQQQVGKDIELLIADKAQKLYREHYRIVYVQGGIFAAIEVACLVAIIVFVFCEKPQRKCKFIEKE